MYGLFRLLIGSRGVYMISSLLINNASPRRVPTSNEANLQSPSSVKTNQTSRFPTQTLNVSTLARQLGESAARAETRDAQLDRRQLSAEAERLLNQILGDVYQAEKAAHNAQIPETDDVALLDRARQATDYVVRSDRHDRTVNNPFAGLSREQLNLIVYDEEGSYTVNERRAAWYGVSDIEAAWNRKLMYESDIESALNSGRTPNFYAEVVAHYKSLPLIEQAQYPEDYEAKRLVRVQDERNPLQQKEPKFLTLFEMLELMLTRKKLDNAPATAESAGIAGIAGAMSKVNAGSSRSSAG